VERPASRRRIRGLEGVRESFEARAEPEGPPVMNGVLVWMHVMCMKTGWMKGRIGQGRRTPDDDEVPGFLSADGHCI
jgi:hypothetical protein